MKRVALSEVKDDLSKFLRMAEKEGIVITRHGKPAWRAGRLVQMKTIGLTIALKMTRDLPSNALRPQEKMPAGWRRGTH